MYFFDGFYSKQKLKLLTHKNIQIYLFVFQYYLKESDIGKNRAEACFAALKSLNSTVNCCLHKGQIDEEFVKKFDVIFNNLIPGFTNKKIKSINFRIQIFWQKSGKKYFCRKNAFHQNFSPNIKIRKFPSFVTPVMY